MKEYDIDSINLFKKAESFKKELKHEYVGTEHLMLAILERNDDFIKKLPKYNLTFSSFYNEVKNLYPKVNQKKDNIYTPMLKRIIYNCEDDFSSQNILYNILNEGEGVAIRILFNMNIDVDSLYKESQSTNIDNLIVFKYGKRLKDYVDINEKVIGRDKEINLIFETLLRKKKNNPLLIGDAGVGKSAIVEELERKIIKGEVPDALKNTEIVTLEMGTLISGTRYRGEFEERLTNIIDEVIKNPNIILFIDEIHTMVSAGGAEGAIGAGDLLKPYLARGEIKCIGATTKNEYEKSIFQDKALTRRFELVLINEPNEEETYNILKNIKYEYENYHLVKITNENLRILVTLANTYFPNKKNPDKAIELLDSVMSYVKLKNGNNIIKNKEFELNKIRLKKYECVENNDFTSALKMNIEEQNLIRQIKTLKSGTKLTINKDDIIDTLEFKNNIIINKEKIVKQNLNKNYDKKVINNLCNKLSKRTSNITFFISGSYGNFIKDLANTLNFEIFNLEKNNIDKLFNKIKYNPSLIITCKEDNIDVRKLLSKIRKDTLVEYQNEYYSFNNTITFLNYKNNSIGFKENYISDIPIDEIIEFKNKVLS